jgi:hypothetical protein
MTDISAVQAVTATSLAPCTYNNGSAGVGATLTATSYGVLEVDNYIPNLGDRVGVTAQTDDPTQNGIYSVTTLGDDSHYWVLTRTTDFNTPATINAQLPFCSLKGITNNASLWCGSLNTVTNIGTDPIQFISITQGFARNSDEQIYATTEYVGIGVSTPSQTLEVYGTSQFNGLTIAYGNFVASNISPIMDSTTAIQIVQSDKTTVIMNFDTVNDRVGIGTTSPAVSLDLSLNTDALALPVGTTGQRPTGSALTNGEIRYNSTTQGIEAYVNGAWISLSGGGGSVTSGNRVLISSTTASNQASVTITDIGNTYNRYELVLLGINPVTTGVNLIMTPEPTGGTYNITSAGTVGNNDWGVNAVMTCYVPWYPNANFVTTGNHPSTSGSNVFISNSFQANYDSGASTTSLVFTFSSGNISSGTFLLYGIVN